MSDVNLASVGYVANKLGVGDKYSIDLASKQYVDNIAAQGGMSMKERTINYTMFEYCYAYYGGTTIQHMPDTSKGKRFMNCFYYCESLTKMPIMDMSTAQHANSFMYRCLKATNFPATNFPAMTHASSMFYYCQSLTGEVVISMPKAKYIPNMFTACTGLTRIEINFDTTSAKDSMDGTFSSCYNVETIVIKNMKGFVTCNYLFSNCKKLKTVIGLDLTKVTYSTGFVTGMFNGCVELEDLQLVGTINISTLDFSPCVKLSKQSILRILNALVSTSTAKNITFNQVHIDMLTEAELAIATNKGWTVLVKQ